MCGIYESQAGNSVFFLSGKSRNWDEGRAFQDMTKRQRVGNDCWVTSFNLSAFYFFRFYLCVVRLDVGGVTGRRDRGTGHACSDNIQKSLCH